MKDPDALGKLVQYFFGIGIILSGIIALISLTIAGIQIIIGQANPEGVLNAKDRIKGSLLGIVLLMASFLIIRSINPVLIETKTTPLTSGAGIFYVKGTQETTCPPSVSDASSISSDFAGGSIVYRCANNIGPDLLIWTYAEKDFKNPTATLEKKCNSDLPIPSSGSFKIGFKTPGLYIFREPGCPADGYRSSVVLITGQIPQEFKGIKGSIQFINDSKNNNYYASIMHTRIDPTGGGNCQYPMLSSGDIDCRNITIDDPSSMNVFIQNKTPESSGDGIDFYSGPYGWDTKGSKAGIFELKKQDIKGNWGYDPKFMVFNYKTNSPSEEQKANPDFKTSSGSIRIKGNYLVALYSSSAGEDGYCQVFTNNVVDLNGTEFIGAGNEDIQMVYVMPAK